MVDIELFPGGDEIQSSKTVEPKTFHYIGKLHFPACQDPYLEAPGESRMLIFDQFSPKAFLGFKGHQWNKNDLMLTFCFFFFFFRSNFLRKQPEIYIIFSKNSLLAEPTAGFFPVPLQEILDSFFAGKSFNILFI